ncbi:Guanine deaminase-like 2 [Homarus americanus]|uniref:Guanine deaminase n=1 Tax=Homarus americanus TaxID=6706 RepID=A0A8J5JBN8_HOMAM|nr:Guanine deaminase-like 2 [Homarus americanus]
MKVFVGTFVHSTANTPMVILTDTALGIVNTKIAFIEAAEKLEQLKIDYGFTDSCIIYLTQSQFMMPGMVDTHIHASQLSNNGLKLDLPLLEWLESYTFPTEAMFSDLKVAQDIYPKVVERLLRNGTTTASYYSTLHLEASKFFAGLVHTKGQRALIGKVNMMVNCPAYYCEDSLEESLKDTEDFIQYVYNMQSPLIQPIITPRFAITCPTDQLKGLAKLAKKYSCHIQSHLCETKSEIEWIQELFPWSKSCTDVYDSTGLLGEKTIMAHCVWMKGTELERLKECNVGVAHCPNSNTSLCSGLCDVRKLLQQGIKVGLGTDCSGGYSPSILDSLRRALDVSRTLNMQHQDNHFLTLPEAFRLATLGGAQVVQMDDQIGNFMAGKEFDALLIDLEDTIEDKIQKFLYNGDDRNIIQVHVAGRCVINQQNH